MTENPYPFTLLDIENLFDRKFDEKFVIVEKRIQDFVKKTVEDSADEIIRSCQVQFSAMDKKFTEKFELVDKKLSEPYNPRRLEKRIEQVEETVFDKHGAYFDGFKKTLQAV